jgi:phospholipid/cholesterol/gamma-HCH transport system substrate-binding protein
MQKDAPSIGRILTMVIFALTCIGLVLFLWLAFGGPTPLNPQAYRFQVHVPEAATLAVESDVRLAGVNVGKVKKKELDKSGARTIVEIELDTKYAPIPKDSRLMLRQKTLLGETYAEITPGDKSQGMLKDGDRLDNAQVEPTVELDEIFSAFDEETRKAWQDWTKELALATKNGRGQDLNDAFGNLAGFATDGAKLLELLDEQEVAVTGLVKNTGRVFAAINERDGALRQLIVNSGNTFEATASRDEALAETFRIFPTFLDESRLTMERLERFSRNTHPLVNQLKGPADDLGPTVRDLGDLAPDLEGLFRDLPPLIRASKTGLPALERVLEGAEPVLEAIHPWLQQLNPILSYFNYHQSTIAGFLSTGGANINGQAGGERYQVNFGMIDERSFERFTHRPDWERANAYTAPNAFLRALPLGTIESFDCKPAGGEIREGLEPKEAEAQRKDSQPPCFVAPASLYNGNQFVVPGLDDQRKVDPPKGEAGNSPANPNR